MRDFWKQKDSPGAQCLLFRNAVLKYRPGTALNHIKKMPGFQSEFQKFFHREVQTESDMAGADLHEPGPVHYTRQQLTEFSPEAYYENLVSKSPLLMATLAGASSKQKFEDIEVSIAQVL